MTLIYVLLVAHFVGDFPAQSGFGLSTAAADWMATNKSQRWDALALHVVVYSAVLFGFVNWCQWIRMGYPVPFPMPVLDGIALFMCANFAAHFVQDAITSRINARLFFLDLSAPMFAIGGPEPSVAHYPLRRPAHWFFVGIGADQLLHYVTLFVTAGWWLQ